ncbi:M14 family zinc carboxypeptidase [Streptomyces sp. NBC_01264]|uniref:M14 family zinc carboxypeptidase n=1 Tax=Streptomyces sp. NBC_01264 TaxID=2903804 RepID=UPI0022515376|nr:M14 family zinc carboxypeptidase [Streptomyces sp. NBC_01264]MCX4783246.1 M14 family zinc carboxypeptidase [Streptomyces sp. NBC_01264]
MTLIRDMCYPTPHELALAARALADEHPALARLRRIGASRAGEPLWLLSVGPATATETAPNVLVVAGAHANEPVGGATALALARRLIHEATGTGGTEADGAATRAGAGVAPAPALVPAAGTTWHFLLCADPDGAALHRTPRPYSLLDYHRNFFRPPGPEQPEWAPSLLPPDRLPPETLALTRLIDELRPALQVSLHGTDLGGSWVQLTRDIPGLAEPFGKSAAELHIPVETSASDASGWPSPGAGIFVMPEPGTTADGPFHPEDTRLSTWYHAHRHAGTTAIVEVPMWASDLVDDPAPHPDPRAALRVLAGRLTADAARVAALREGAAGGTDPDAAALLRAVDWTLALIPRIAAEWTGPGAPAEATAAYIGSIDAFGRRLSLRAAAMLLRVLRAQGHPAAPAVDRLVTGWCEEFGDRFQARWVPVATQVEHQSRVVLAAYDRLVAAGL